MKLFLTSAYPKHLMLDELRKRAADDSVGQHTVCRNPQDADIILFVENGHFDDYQYRRLRQHPLLKTDRRKCYMYNELDRPSLVLPGLYCNLKKRFLHRNRQTPFPFLQTPNKFVKNIYRDSLGDSRSTLFSFVGAASHRCRRQVLKLTDDSTHIEDTSVFNVWHSCESRREIEGRKFAKGMTDCLFSLCPRGLGTSSFRLFESMEAGRAPVIISDQWAETTGIDWSFAIRLKERHVKDIPRILASLQDEAVDRGNQARVEWQKSYSPDKIFNTACDALAKLQIHPQTHRKVYLARLHSSLVNRELQTVDTLRTYRNRILAKGATAR